MSHYKPYPAYKDSGVEWIGMIPQHWSRGSLKYILSQPITDGPHETPVFISEGVEFLSVDGIQEGELVFEGKRFISAEDHRRYSLKAKPQLNDVLVGKSASVGKVARVKTSIEFNVWSPLAILRSDAKKCLPGFLEYSLKGESSQRQIYLEGNTSTQANISMDRLGCVGIAFPPIGEQAAIASRIDRETSRIDALIAKKTRFIELLKEKRQALITHAVTKGLNPNVKMKDSGVAWIGEVPEHWECGALGYYSTIKTGGTPERKNEEYWGGNIPWVKTGEVNYREIYDSEEKITEEGLANSSAQISPPGTILMAMYGMGVTRGRVAMLAKSCAYNQACAAISCSTLLANTYLYTCLEAAYNAIRDLGNEASQINLNIEIISKIKIPVPPLVEQSAIVQKVRFGLSKVDTLIQQTDKSIDLLKERRSAFITAAVTGQVDLRSGVHQ